MPECRVPYSPITLNRVAHYGGLVLRGGTKRELAEAMTVDATTVLVAEAIKTGAERFGLNEFVSSPGTNDDTVVGGVRSAAKMVKSAAKKIQNASTYVLVGTVITQALLGEHQAVLSALSVVQNAVSFVCDPVKCCVKIPIASVFAGFDSTQLPKVKIVTLQAQQ